MKTFKKLLGLLLTVAIITSMLTLPSLADDILSVSTNAGGAAAYGNSERYFFDMSYKMGDTNPGSASFGTGVTPTWEAADPKDNSNEVLKIATTNQVADYAKLNFQTGLNKYESEGPQIIGFDFLVSGVEVADSVSGVQDLLVVNPYGKNGWTGSGHKLLNIRKGENDETVIKAYNGATNWNYPTTQDPEGAVFNQDTWYTCYIYTDYTYGKASTGTDSSGNPTWANNFASHLFIGAKGAGFQNAWYVSTCYIDQKFEFHQPIAAYIASYGKNTKNGFTYYIDNLFIDSVVSVDDAKIYATKGEKSEVDFYVAPGFTTATVSAFGEEVALADNGTGYYTLNMNIPANAEVGFESITVNAIYPQTRQYHSYGKTMIATEEVLVATAPSYTYSRLNDGTNEKLFFFDFSDENTTPSFQAQIDSQGTGTVDKTIDNGYNFVNDATDKALKIAMTNINKGGLVKIGEYNHSYPRYPVASSSPFMRFKADLKFSSADFKLLLQHKTGAGDWITPTLVDNSTKKFVNSNIDFAADTWYRLEFVYDLVNGTITGSVNGEKFYEESTGKNLEKTRIIQFLCYPPESGNTATGTVWVDNLSKELATVYSGIKNYTPVVENNGAFTVKLEEAVYGKLYTAELLYSDNASAGTAEFDVDAVTDMATTLTVTPDASFDTKRDITLVIKSGNDVIDTKTFIMKDSATEAISEISLSQDGTYVYANIKAMSAEAVGTLYLVGYNADFTRLTNISIVPVSASETLESFGAKLTKGADDVNYKAFLWSPAYAPIEAVAPLVKN